MTEKDPESKLSFVKDTSSNFFFLLPPSGKPSFSFVAWITGENEFWRDCLMEMKAGYSMACGKQVHVFTRMLKRLDCYEIEFEIDLRIPSN